MDGYLVGDALDLLARLPAGAVDLVVTSPPYNVGKAYESAASEKEYADWTAAVAAALARAVAPAGAVCWQVGNTVVGKGSSAEELPLDVVAVPLFRAAGFRLRNRVVWRVPHGLACARRCSPRYETLLWFTRSDEYTFNVDEAREPQQYPGKEGKAAGKEGKGKRGNPAGKGPTNVWDLILTEMDEGWIGSCCSVKYGHPERTGHPAQYPIELAERCVLLFSRPGDVVLDPFAGSGTTGLAALFHGRECLLFDKEEGYRALFRARRAQLAAARLPYRPLGAAKREYKDKRAVPSEEQLAEWRRLIAEKRRICELPHARDPRYLAWAGK